MYAAGSVCPIERSMCMGAAHSIQVIIIARGENVVSWKILLHSAKYIIIIMTLDIFMYG